MSLKIDPINVGKEERQREMMARLPCQRWIIYKLLSSDASCQLDVLHRAPLMESVTVTTTVGSRPRLRSACKQLSL